MQRRELVGYEMVYSPACCVSLERITNMVARSAGHKGGCGNNVSRKRIYILVVVSLSLTSDLAQRLGRLKCGCPTDTTASSSDPTKVQLRTLTGCPERAINLSQNSPCGQREFSYRPMLGVGNFLRFWRSWVRVSVGSSYCLFCLWVLAVGFDLWEINGYSSCPQTIEKAAHFNLILLELLNDVAQRQIHWQGRHYAQRPNPYGLDCVSLIGPTAN